MAKFKSSGSLELMNTFFDYTVKDAKKIDHHLSQYKGQVVLVVNVASECGYTPQYAGLQELYEKYKAQGFTVIGFPCNQFGGQEPGSNEEIQSFCSLKFLTTFPVLAKINVNGSDTAPIYDYLKKSAPGLLGTEMIKWNFTKFLVNKEGQVINRYAPQTEPMEIEKDIQILLAK